MISKKNKIINFIFLTPFIWCVTGLLFYFDAPKDMVAIAIVTMLTFLIFHGYKEAIYNFNGSIIPKLVAISLFSMIIADTYHGYSSTSIRAFSVSLVMLIFTPKSIIEQIRKNLHILIFVGSLSSFVFVFYEFYILNHGRYWSINPVRYTTIASTLAIVSLMISILSKNKTTKVISILSLLMSFNVLILGQTRGTLLAFISSLIAFFIVLKLTNNNKTSKWWLISLTLISLPLLYLNKSVIEHRYNSTVQEVVRISSGNLDTSIGLRLQMWKSGFAMIKESPFIGYGNTHFREKEQQHNEGFISQQTTIFTHYHNQFIDSFVKLGIIGFLSVTSLFLAPWFLYFKYRTQTNFMMAIVSFSYTIASLTDVPLYHPQTIIFYFMLISLMDTNPNQTAGNKRTQ